MEWGDGPVNLGNEPSRYGSPIFADAAGREVVAEGDAVYSVANVPRLGATGRKTEERSADATALFTVDPGMG
jgi:hypothetical protein